MWIARDENNCLYLYTNKPKKSSDGYWYSEKGDVMDISEFAFPEVKREDKEPRELVLKPINEEQGFVNLYKDGGQVKVGWKIFPTKKEAEENFKDDEKYITTANIQWRDSHDNL